MNHTKFSFSSINYQLLFLPISIFLIAFILNLAYIGWADWGAELLSVYRYSDSYWHLHRAWHSTVVNPEGGVSQYFVPDAPYVWLLTWGYRVFGVGEAVPFLINACCISLAAAFLATLARRQFGTAAGWIAGCLAAFYGPFVFFSGITVKTSLVVCLFAIGLYFAIRYFQERRVRLLFFAMLFFGIAALDRNNAIVLMLLLLIFVIHYAV